MQLLEHGGRVPILRIERERFLVVLDGLGLVARSHVGFAEAVVGVSRIRVQLDVELKDANRVGGFLPRQQTVAQGIDGAERSGIASAFSRPSKSEMACEAPFRRTALAKRMATES